MKKLLKLKDAAEHLGVPEGSLRSAAVKHGFLIRIGNAVRIDPDDLTALIEACRVPAPQSQPQPQPQGQIRHDVDHSPVSVHWTKGALEVAEDLKALGRKRKTVAPR